MPANRVVVVGTTPDYVDVIRRRFPGRAIFLSHYTEGPQSNRCLHERDELFCDLNAHDEAVQILEQFLNRGRVRLTGVCCFDCESLPPAAAIAERFGLPFLSVETAAICRNKHAMLEAWRWAGIPCPAGSLAGSHSDLRAFIDVHGTPAVLKPISGSGSELVLKCSTEDECNRACSLIMEQLSGHPDERMYPRFAGDSSLVDPRRAILIEEFIEGDEYSCDFVIDNGNLHVLRVAKKVSKCNHVFGTTEAYILPVQLPLGFDYWDFLNTIRKAAVVLGIDRALCMLDFIIRDNQPVIIELSPRPGGDCLPDLMLWSGGFDIIGWTIDFAEGTNSNIPDTSKWSTLVGLRLISSHAGTIQRLDIRKILRDPRVMECRLRHSAGHNVILPPFDYDSRVLGHVIFDPDSLENIEDECKDIASKLIVEMDNELWIKPKAS